MQGSSGSSAGPASATAAGLVAFGIGSETSGSILSPAARCGVTGLRPTFGRVSRYGVMALSWTQDRLGPLCRYAEDCAMVMAAIAKPDARDMSVSEIPFNWTAQLDVKKLRMGYIQDDGKLRAADEKTLRAVEALGVKLVPVRIPEGGPDTANYGVESAAFFNEMLRTGLDKKLTNPGRADGWRGAYTMPAVEYLQSQRARMMMKLAEATEGVDVYLAPNLEQQGGGGGGAAGENGAPRRQGAVQRHSTMANRLGIRRSRCRMGLTKWGSRRALRSSRGRLGRRSCSRWRRRIRMRRDFSGEVRRRWAGRGFEVRRAEGNGATDSHGWTRIAALPDTMLVARGGV
ncbi:MAG: amidase [Acidobacteriota bacterium]